MKFQGVFNLSEFLIFSSLSSFLLLFLVRKL
nr:MAG TPA: hypothetical protein [Caudoviricetes sp.]